MCAKKIIWCDREQAGRLHCDACHHDMEAGQPFVEALIGTPCPQCGADMLTRQDYESTLRMFEWIDWINRWFGPIFGRHVPPPSAVRVQVKLHDGACVVKVK